MAHRIARYFVEPAEHYGLLDEDGTLHRLAGPPFGALEPTGITDRLADVRLLAPVAHPRIFGIGLNYVAHIREAGAPTPDFPMVFMKPSTAAIGPGDAIVYPREGQEVHYEGELAVIIGRRCRRVPADEALSVVLGYTCGNDVSERVRQFAEMKTGCLVIGKGYDTFNPLGPVIATDLDPGNLELTARLNGEVRQHSQTSDLLFAVPQLIAYLSAAITLLPGDVIMTGTPAGVGPVAPGDTVEVEIAGIGVLSNPVVAEG